MSVAKKNKTVNDDQVSAKIQRKFDLVFSEKDSKNTVAPNGLNNKLNNAPKFDVNEMVVERNNPKNKDSLTKSGVDLDLSFHDNSSLIRGEATSLKITPKESNEIDFALDFDMDLVKKQERTKLNISIVEPPIQEDIGGFTLEDSEIGDVDHRVDATKKTELFSTGFFNKATTEEMSLENNDESSSSLDLMSSEEAKNNIESTINDILRSDLEEASIADLSMIQPSHKEIENSILDLGHTPSSGFSLSEINNEDYDSDKPEPTKIINSLNSTKNRDIDLQTSIFSQNDVTMDFDLGGLTSASLKQDKSESDEDEFDVATKIAILDFNQLLKPSEDHTSLTSLTSVALKSAKAAQVEKEEPQNAAVETLNTPETEGLSRAGLNTEDSMRFQATIRALREERDELLLKMKSLKGESRELEQDNLTLKANLDEAKIEISILRKRHMVEIEDLKYRTSLSEEKKSMSDEKAKLADMRREKLEQKVRIDFNQVKQREKELESKLELLSMDVESQVHSRDHKILELRRKIDALEFNMENASIKEQRSHDDKRKLEDRLNKIMKTLRHSIKNLEDDSDHVEDSDDHQKDKY